MVDPTKGNISLVQKYQKMIDSGRFSSISLTFGPGGSVVAKATYTPAEGDDKTEGLIEALAATKAQTQETPWDEEKVHLLKKFETRLDTEAPEALRNADSRAAFNAALAAVPFAQRKAFILSNKDFETEYIRFEDGTPVRRPAEDVAALKAERVAARKPAQNRGGNRGRGRGGRGRGAAFQAPQAPAEGA